MKNEEIVLISQGLKAVIIAALPSLKEAAKDSENQVDDFFVNLLAALVGEKRD